MGCYHPILGIPDYTRQSKQYKLTCRFEPEFELMYPGSVMIPCGKCYGCRMDYSRNWADRMMLELDHTKKGLFATLTYDDEHLPKLEDDSGTVYGATLDKSDLQLFMKVLRGRKKFEDREIRFFASGEYGSTTRRPHYHIILFGISLDDFDDLHLRQHNLNFDALYDSAEFAGMWKKGFCLLGNVTWRSCAYVARYVVKKASNELLPYPGCQPEFSLMSRRPGLGAYYLQEHDVDLRSTTFLENGQKLRYPKYFLKLLEKSDPELYNTLKAERQAFSRDSVLTELQQTDLCYSELLQLKEDRHIQGLKKLSRCTV